MCEASLLVEQLEFPAGGSGPRNLSAWVSGADVEVSYFRVFKDKEKVRQTKRKGKGFL